MKITDVFENPTIEKAKRFIKLHNELIDLYATSPKYKKAREAITAEVAVVKEYIQEQSKIAGAEVSSSNLVVNRKYKLSFPNDSESVATLKEIRSNSLGDDYFFTWESGYDGLCNKYHGKTENLNDFPFPKSLFHMVTFTDIKDKK